MAMKILATLHTTKECEFRLRISPRARADGTLEDSTVSVWAPSNASEGFLMYNPVISINIRSRRDKQVGVIIPINLAYALEDSLSVIHNRLSTKGLFTMNNNQMYVDAKVAEKCAVKMNCYRDNIVFYPVIIHGYNDEELKGVRIIYRGQTIGDLIHTELREICEMLNHLDLRTYALITSVLERMELMDSKLDKIIAGQNEILSLLHQQGLSNIKQKGKFSLQSDQSGLNWKPNN